MLPRLQKHNKKRRVATYMSGFDGITPIAVEKTTPAHQPDAQWPVFLYELGGKESTSDCEESDSAPPFATATTIQVGLFFFRFLDWRSLE
jgi:hypothetical protein